MEARRGDMLARLVQNELEIGNSRIRARFVLRDGGYTQEFYGADGPHGFRLLLSSLHKNLIPASEHRACASPMISGERPHLFGISRESLRMVYSTAEVTHHDEDRVTALLSGTAMGHQLSCEITIHRDANTAHVTVRDTMDSDGRDPLVEYHMSSYAFIPGGRELRVGEKVDYAWAPNLRPGYDHLIGDCCFYSPAVIVQKGHSAVALIPDTASMGGHRVMPFSLDLDMRNGLLPAPLLSFGLCGYEQTPDGKYCRHDISMARRVHTNCLEYSYHLLIDAACKTMTAHQQVARLLWETCGASTLGARAGDQRPQWDSSYTIQPDAWAAYGLHALGARRGDAALSEQGRQTKQQVLSAPRSGGLFPTRFDPSSQQWTGCRLGPSGAIYHTAECAVQTSWLLEWHRSVGKDPWIVRQARALVDHLISVRLRSGAVPSWYGADLAPLPELRSSAETAASALLMAELASATGLAKYARAAEHSARFVLGEIVPQHEFADSLVLDRSGWAAPTIDEHSGARPCGGWALLWTARMCLELHTLTGSRRYLDMGMAVLDQLCLLQSVGPKPWLRENGKPGACVRGNIRADVDAELTAEFARCALDYGAASGEREYFERGAAALQAAMAETEASQLPQARLAATASIVRAKYGWAYVHVGRKWAVAIAGPTISRVDLSPGAIDIGIDTTRNGYRSARMVFAGMRGKSYKVTINGRSRTCSRDDMESGIPLPEPDRPVVQEPDLQHTNGPADAAQLSFEC